MSHVAIELGIDPATARELVLQTIIGTAQYLSREPIAFSELRARVTSPKGTTAAAIETLSNAGAEDVMQAAVRAAFARAVELSR
jgi:pyrroline-5-carboxylate reductase